MNSFLIAAGCLTIIVGLIHSVMGEILIFRRMRQSGWIPTQGGSVLKERHVRIIWASWHIVTIFGWGFGAILLRLSIPSSENTLQIFIENTIMMSMFFASLLVLIGTKAKHPGWFGLLGIAIFLWVK